MLIYALGTISRQFIDQVINQCIGDTLKFLNIYKYVQSTTCLHPARLPGRWNVIPMLTKRKFLERLHSGLCSAAPGSDCPWVQSPHVSDSCHGFPNSEVKGRLPAPAHRFPFDRGQHHRIHGMCSQRFPLDQLLAGFIAVFRS